MLGLAAEVHENVSVAEHHLQGYEEVYVVEDVHTSPTLGTGKDYARVYKKDCNADGTFCDYCAIAFTATTDAWDFEEDLNISLTPFCGLDEVHGGFAQEMRTYMQQPEWAGAMDLLTRDKCGTAYSVGTSLGAAVAALFAFCANNDHVPVDNIDKAAFPGSFDMSLVMFGAPATAKSQLYNRQPGQCFRGARVAIQQGTVNELDATKTLTGLRILDSLLVEAKAPNAALQSGIADLASQTNDLALFAQTKATIIEIVLPQSIIDLKELVMQIVAPSDNADDLVKLIPFVLPLDQLTMLVAGRSLLQELTIILDPNQYAAPYTPTPDFGFEYDVTPALLSGFKYLHPLVPYYRVPHPMGVDPPSQDVVACTDGPPRPEVDFLQVLYATVANFAEPLLTGKGEPGFPNHHPCCYFRGLTGLGDEGCGNDAKTGKAYTCEAPKWR